MSDIGNNEYGGEIAGHETISSLDTESIERARRRGVIVVGQIPSEDGKTKLRANTIEGSIARRMVSFITTQTNSRPRNQLEEICVRFVQDALYADDRTFLVNWYELAIGQESFPINAHIPQPPVPPNKSVL